jgi:hypothetical protein
MNCILGNLPAIYSRPRSLFGLFLPPTSRTMSQGALPNRQYQP